MVTRRPLVIVDGQVQELPAGDLVPGVEGVMADAPEDGKQYARKDGAWVEVVSGGGSGLSAGKAIALSMIFGG